MIIFLTSSPTGPLDGSRQVDGLDKKNHFVDELDFDFVHYAQNMIATKRSYIK